MTTQAFDIPSSDIWLAAEAAILAYGPEATSIVDRTVAEYETSGNDAQAAAWRTVAAAVRELMDAALHPASIAIH